MALYRGGLEPSAIYRGNQPVQKVYRGGTEVWSSSTPPSGTVTKVAPPNGFTRMVEYEIPEDGRYEFRVTVTAPGLAYAYTFVNNSTITSSFALENGTATRVVSSALKAGDKIALDVYVEASPVTATLVYDIVLMPLKSFSYNFTFNDLNNIWWAPLSGFDPRTDSNAPKAPAWSFNGMVVAPDSNVPAYLYHLVNREVDGDAEWTFTFGDAMNTRARPSSVIIYSDPSAYQKLVVELGSDGLEVVNLSGTARTSLGTRNRALSAGNAIRIVKSGGQLTFYQNGSLWAYVDISSVESYYTSNNNMCYTGFGLYSTSGQWSSRIQNLAISGLSSYDEVMRASASFRGITIPRSSWTEISAVLVNTPGSYNIVASGSWPQASSSSDRRMRIKVNGAVVATGADEDTYINVPSAYVGTYQWVIVEAYAATSDSNYRRIANGSLNLYPTA